MSRYLRPEPGTDNLALVSEGFAATRWMPWPVALVALVVAGWNCWMPGLWHDDVATLVAAERSWPSLFAMLTQVDTVHGFYYVLMHLWLDVVDYSPLTLRLPSVMAVAGTSVVLAKLGQRLWNPAAGAVAALTFVMSDPPRRSAWWLSVLARRAPGPALKCERRVR
jgi:hypothetical protein